VMFVNIAVVFNCVCMFVFNGHHLKERRGSTAHELLQMPHIPLTSPQLPGGRGCKTQGCEEISTDFQAIMMEK